MAPQNNFLEKISKRFKGQRKLQELLHKILLLNHKVSNPSFHTKLT